VTAVAAPAPGATFAPGAVPASVSGNELGDRDSSSPLISGDGRFVVFTTRAAALLGTPGNAAEYYSVGLVRKDLVSGAVDVVATPERRLRADGSLVAPAAAAAAAGISDDGRYVLFGSTARLVDAVESTITPEVYVRDMTLPRSDSASFELVSAVDGAERPALYDDRTLGSSPGLAGFGLSDDGRRAVFVTQSASSLPAGEAEPLTPRWQVLVRDLDADTTRLVTRVRGDATASGTPVTPSPAAVQPQPAISGDGTAVAWVGTDAQQQARFLPGESTTPASRQLLWRDVEAGAAAVTRRAAGEADPDDPACPPDAIIVPDETATGPCYGPFAAPDDETAGSEATPPTLVGISDDGRRLLFSASSKRRPFDAGANRFGVGFLADMTPGVTRKAGVAVAWSQPQSRPPVEAAALAGDGRRAAFASLADRFEGLQPVGSFQSGDLLTQNVFAADLGARTVERATVAPDGADFTVVGTDAGLTSVSVSDDGGAIAFAARDGNLFVGDVNDALDVQVVRRPDPGIARAGRDLPPPPPPSQGVVEPPLPPLAQINPAVERVRVGARGVATVRVRVPGAGRLTAQATGTVPRSARAGGARRGRRVAVGRDGRTLRRAGVVTLRIAPSRAARRALARPPRRLEVALRIRFSAVGGTSRSDQAYTLRGAARQTRRTTATAPRGRR
jgi:hypothetical protein